MVDLEKKKIEKEKQRGITLIALVVTIIILLILAGISISMLTGSNGILSKATKAGNEMPIEQIREEIRLAVAAALIQGNGEITRDNLKIELKRHFGENYNINSTDDGNKLEVVAWRNIENKVYELVTIDGKIIASEEDEEENEMYSVEVLEEQIAPTDLFEYEILTEPSSGKKGTAKILRVKEEYHDRDYWRDYETDNRYYKIKSEEGWYYDTLIVPYEVEIENKLYKITEVNLYWDEMALPLVSTIIYPNTVKVISGCMNEEYSYMDDHYLEACNDELSTVIFPKNLRCIEGAVFGNCSELTNIEIPNTVTSIGNYAFYKCRGLTSIEIPNNVTSIGMYAFFGCSGLTSIEISNSVTSIGEYAFSGCSGLTNIEIPNSVTSIGGDAFLNTLWYNNLPDGDVYIGKVYYKYKGTMPENTNLIIREGTTYIGDGAFSECSGLTSIEIPNSVTSIGEYAFSECSGLTSIEIPNNVTSIEEHAFYYCSGLTSIEIPNSVTSIGSYAFFRCSGLTSIEIPNSVTSIGSYAFSRCSGLTNIEISNSVTSIGGYAFNYCSGLTSIEIPNSVTSIGGNAFGNCTALTKIYIPNSVEKIIANYGYSSPFYNSSSTLKIYCEIEENEKPTGWGTYWNNYNNSNKLSVKWGYTVEQFRQE